MLSVKRKRGRPRLDEPREIKDFDNNLIQEFKKFPVFYDRQHPQHRNRDYTDHIWQRIAQNLNVSTNLVKTRMLQLRNRFNLEKRRVEAMKDQHRSVTSQWSLYESLSFLSNYVKTRRPYSLPVTYNPRNNSTSSSSDGGVDDNEVAVTKTQENASDSNHTLNKNFYLTNKKNGDISVNQKNLSNECVSAQFNRSTIQPTEANADFGSKYNAFGQFLASSLIEMNEIQALNLVERFTMDIVKYLKNEEKKRNFIHESERSNADVDDDNSITVY